MSSNLIDSIFFWALWKRRGCAWRLADPRNSNFTSFGSVTWHRVGVEVTHFADLSNSTSILTFIERTKLVLRCRPYTRHEQYLNEVVRLRDYAAIREHRLLGKMSIKAIIYSKFDPLEGPKIVHQVPENSILTTGYPDTSELEITQAVLSFPTVSRFLIPRQSLCGNLITLHPPRLTSTSPQCLIISQPTCLKGQQYPRNEFIFNFALVLSPPDTVDVPSYKSVVSKLAHLMKSLEEQSRFLSEDVSAPQSGKVYSLCETLMEDLNNYAECMIPIDEINTLNVKLFPTLPNPVPVKAWYVPLFTVKIESLMDDNWDLTMQRVIPFINGVNSVKRIAVLADADIKLTRKCIRHLLYYGCILLLDIFSFNAIYGPSSEFSGLIASNCEMQAECARYVNTAFEPGRQEHAAGAVDGSGSFRSSNAALTTVTTDDDFWPTTTRGEPIDGVGIVQLYASLQQGVTVREWYLQNTNMLANIDIRRFITFGIIKGFLYRIHRYALQTSRLTAASLVEQDSQQQLRQADIAQPSSVDTALTHFLDGTHCFDEICTHLAISEKELMSRLNQPQMGEVVVFCR